MEGGVVQMQAYNNNRNRWDALAIAIAICALPIIIFVLVSLWPHKELVAWILLGLGILVVLARLALWLTTIYLRTAEEKLRKERLYANERLIEHERQYRDRWTAEPVKVDEPEEPYSYQPRTRSLRRRAPNTDAPYEGGLPPLSIRSDWED
jgi:hypothetical protein